MTWNLAISVTNVGISIPMKNSPTTAFFPRNSNLSMMKAVMVPNITLKKRETINIIPVFLKPSNKYLSVRTSVKFSKVIRSGEGSSSGEVTAMSALVFSAANSVRRIGASTTATIHRQIICFAICVTVLFVMLPSSCPLKSARE